MIVKCSVQEFAPGIPAKERILPIPSIGTPKIWKFGLQFHEAVKAGKHFDLRIGDPQGNAHSWVVQRLPEPGQRVGARQQPTHTVAYMPFHGEIASGYGKGLVHSVRFEPTEVVKAGPDQLTFHLHRGHKSEEYTLIRTNVKENTWLLVNHTATRKSKPQLPSSKPRYREISFESATRRLDRPDELMTAKVDGGHNTFLLETGKPLRVFSYRPTKRPTGLIEHTHKLPGALENRVPKGLGGTILRGELYARDKSGRRPLPAETVGGMLNANVWLSRQRQQERGALRAAIFDVVQWRGRNVENAPYSEKLVMLQEVQRKMPGIRFELPESATTTAAKAKLLQRIVAGKHPQTHEGVVFWDMAKGGPPVKAKIVQEYDETIRGFLPGKGALAGREIGAIQYGSPGKIRGRVGTGMSRAIREDMHKHPEKYLGKVMRLTAQGKFPSGALRAPRFRSLHLDTLAGEGEKIAMFRTMTDELRVLIPTGVL